MIENRYQYVIKKNGKKFILNFAVDSTVPELFDVASEIRSDMLNRLKQNEIEEQKLKEEAEKKQAEQKVEPIKGEQDV